MNKDMQAMTLLAEDAAGQVMAGQRAALAVLLAEMKALSAMLPGAGPYAAPDSANATGARLRAEEAEAEAAFDNMPV